MVGQATRKRNNDIPGQCSESRECIAERQTNTTHNQRRKERETKKGQRNREGKKKERQREKVVTKELGCPLSVQHS